jgi:hypothetical protein
MSLTRVRVAAFGAVCIGLGAGATAVVSHLTAPTASLTPAILAPASANQNNDPAAQRAIALVVGQTRASDHATFDQWYRARLNKLAPGIAFEYNAQLSGRPSCGEWAVFAGVIPGPATGPRNTPDVLNQYGAIASVLVQTGSVGGLDFGTADRHVFMLATRCSIQIPSDGHTWLDEFRAGAAP